MADGWERAEGRLSEAVKQQGERQDRFEDEMRESVDRMEKKIDANSAEMRQALAEIQKALAEHATRMAQAVGGAKMLGFLGGAGGVLGVVVATSQKIAALLPIHH